MAQYSHLPVFDPTEDPGDVFAETAYQALKSAPPIARTSRGDFLVTGHPEAVRVLRDPHAEPRFDYQTTGSPWNQLAERFFVFLDGSVHRRLRSAFDAEFTRRALDSAPLSELSDRRAAAFMTQLAGKGTADVITDFAVPCTVEILCSVLGIADEAVANVVDLAARVRSTGDQDKRFLDRVASELESVTDALMGAACINQRMLTRIEEACGKDGALVRATVSLLLLAGFETSANLFANIAFALLWDPRRVRALVGAGPEVLPTAVEELLRLYSPAHVVARIARQPIEVGGTVLPEGARIAVFLRLCNTDTRVFADSHLMDLRRSPNPHLSFSHGRHYCLGATLARMEMGTMLQALMPYLTRLDLAGSAPEWTEQALGRSLITLPVRLRTPDTDASFGAGP
ncbi:cytochrome P450 [Streptomyces sp. G-G2]|uniref:cytochrome P450 n=1 Tax=Streptomyces sp. G-G2 TaxID=3046201 RepID=UPI0024BAC642|nr:cytochrome P450 [Streptomyces sp. G-G2]MDJ0386086.1 cytochrome P450 [Streptomyces sp. G-G2]